MESITRSFVQGNSLQGDSLQGDSVQGDSVQGEQCEAPARVVIAPGAGVFQPQATLASGTMIHKGQIIGHLTSGEVRTPVVSPFAGQTGAALAWAGERLSTHQPVMWLSLASDAP